MSTTTLITGGAGFIGSHLADALLQAGYAVRVLDNLSEQVHGPGRQWPGYLNPGVERILGDVRDPDAVRYALDGVTHVVHLAAAVGVGQSMYEVSEYTATNNQGTAVLLEALIEHPVDRLVVASSMSLYGEGLYRSRDGRIHEVLPRTRAHLERHAWEVLDAQGTPLQPVPTPETKTPDPRSVYALSKYDQERLCLMIGEAYDIPAAALRFFNVYGPRQALSNPYTGVLAIFAARYLNGAPPLIFEDGRQQRDFVSVYDVAQAIRRALEQPKAAAEVFNIGSGQAASVCEIAGRLAEVLGTPHIQPEIVQQYRVGDIRHCFADITKARRLLGYEPQVTLHQGLEDLAAWLDGQTATDGVGRASAELAERGLTV